VSVTVAVEPDVRWQAWPSGDGVALCPRVNERAGTTQEAASGAAAAHETEAVSMIPVKAVAERNARRQAWPDASGVARRSRRAAGVERQRSRRERESEARRQRVMYPTRRSIPARSPAGKYTDWST
jgi:hypothetical protein